MPITPPEPPTSTSKPGADPITAAAGSEPHRPPGPLVETRDFNPRVIGGIALGLVVAALVLHLTLGGMLSVLSWLAGPVQRTAVRPEAVPHWVNEVDERLSYQAREERLLTTYGWIDRPAHVVRLPIERAMTLIARRGIAWRLGDGSPWTHQEVPAAHQDLASTGTLRP